MRKAEAERMRLHYTKSLNAGGPKPEARNDWLLARILDWQTGVQQTAEAMSYLIAEVVALGPGQLSPKGFFIPPRVKVGDTILVEEHIGCRTPIEGREHLLLSQEEAIPLSCVGLLADAEA